MLQIKSFTFNPFSENTYVLYDETLECVIIDPGCYDSSEQQELADFIAYKQLKPVKLLNTHCHVDHVFGNLYAAEKWNLQLHMNREDLPVLDSFPKVCQMYGLMGSAQPEPSVFLEEGDEVKVGNSTLKILFTPGHSPGSICFYDEAEKVVIGGDVLFQGGIGRTDLPGGSFEVLEQSIRTKLYTLPDDVKVYPGHGPHTIIGWEKVNNPFVTA